MFTSKRISGGAGAGAECSAPEGLGGQEGRVVAGWGGGEYVVAVELLKSVALTENTVFLDTGRPSSSTNIYSRIVPTQNPSGSSASRCTNRGFYKGREIGH